MDQLSIPLPRLEARGREDFMVSPSNATALRLVETWPDWPEGRLALIGPAGAGKSHLAAIWAEEAGARILPCAALSADEAPQIAAAPLVLEDCDRGCDETI